jgi:REP element-mobilizing transposase RayT
MPRPPRDSVPGVHHIGSGAAGPAIYYRDEIDFASWIRLFAATASRYGWTVIIVVQLTTHWHAIVEVTDHSLPEGMQCLNCRYSREFNERHGRVGYLVRDRYWSRRKTTETELVNAFCYAANNPLTAGLVKRAEDWRWSSYATTIGLSDAFPFVDASVVVAQFGPTPDLARAGLRQHVTGMAAREAAA